MADVALDITRLLEKVSGAVPVVGAIPQAIFGMATVLLEKAKKAKDDERAFQRVAIQAADLALAIEQALQWHQEEELGIMVKPQLDELLQLLEEINHSYIKYSRLLSFSKTRNRSKYLEKWNSFSTRLTYKQQSFQTLSLIATATSLSILRREVRTTTQRVEQVQDHVVYIQEQAPAVRSAELATLQRQLDDDGLTVFAVEDIAPDSLLIDNRYSIRGKMDNNWVVLPEVEMVVYTARRGPSVYLVKEFHGETKELVTRSFEDDTSIQLRNRYLTGLRIIGTVGRRGIVPSQVYSMSDSDWYMPLLPFVKESMLNGRETDAVRLFLQLYPTIQALNALCLTRGCEMFDRRLMEANDWYERKVENIVENSLIKMSRKDGKAQLSVVYAGQLFSTPKPTEISRYSCANYIAQRLPPNKVFGQPYLNQASVLHGIDNIPFPATIESMAEYLFRVGMLDLPLKGTSGYSFSVGDIGYEADTSTFVVLDNVLHSFFTSYEQVDARRLGGDVLVPVYDNENNNIWSFQLGADTTEVEIIWHRRDWTDDLGPALYRYLTQDKNSPLLNSGYSHVKPSDVCIVSRVEIRHVIMLDVRPPSTSELYLHVYPISTSSPPELLVSISFEASAAPESPGFPNRAMNGSTQHSGCHVDWLNCASSMFSTPGQSPIYYLLSLPSVLFPNWVHPSTFLRSADSTHSSGNTSIPSFQNKFWNSTLQNVWRSSPLQHNPFGADLAYLENIAVTILSGTCSLNFSFTLNPHFNQRHLRIAWSIENNPLSEILADQIRWEEGKDLSLCKVIYQEKNSLQERGRVEQSFQPGPYFWSIFKIPKLQNNLPSSNEGGAILLQRAYILETESYRAFLGKLALFVGNITAVISTDEPISGLRA